MSASSVPLRASCPSLDCRRLAGARDGGLVAGVARARAAGILPAR